MHPVNIVEPTLANEAGHCSMVVHSLCDAGVGLPFRLWVGRSASLPTLEGSGLDIRPHFSRRLRKLQAILLYRHLLRDSARRNDEMLEARHRPASLPQ